MAGDFRVLRATGIESEAELPYAALHQLLRPLEDRIDRLAEPQARALSGALGLAHEREADRFLIGVGVLTLLADAAEDQPLLALLDDAAWFDHESARRARLHGAPAAGRGRGAAVRGPRRAGPGRSRCPASPSCTSGASATPRRGSCWATASTPRAATRSSHARGGNPLALLELAAGRTARRRAAPRRRSRGASARCRSAPRTLLLIAAADTTHVARRRRRRRRAPRARRRRARARRVGRARARRRRDDRVPPSARALGRVPRGAVRGPGARPQALADALTGDRTPTAGPGITPPRCSAPTRRRPPSSRGRRAVRSSARATPPPRSALERAGELSPDEDDRRAPPGRRRPRGRAGGRARARAQPLLDRVGRRHRPALVATAAVIRGWTATDAGADTRRSTGSCRRCGPAAMAAPALALQAAVRAIEVAGQARTPERLAELRALLEDDAGQHRRRASTLAVAQGLHRVRRRRLRRDVPRARRGRRRWPRGRATR